MGHTGDQITGSVCKCMDCARKRNERALKAARRHFPGDHAALVEAQDHVEDVEAELARAREVSRTLAAALRRRGMETLIAEDPNA